MADSNDSLLRNDPKSQELAYNNTTDRMKVELPLYSANFSGRFHELSSDTIGNIVWTPAAGKRYVITDFMFNSAQPGYLKVYDGVDVPGRVLMQFAMPSGVTVDHTFSNPFPSSNVNTSLLVDCSPGCSGYLSVWGYEL